MASKKNNDTVVTIDANGNIQRKSQSEIKTQTKPKQNVNTDSVVTMKNGKIVRETQQAKTQTTTPPKQTIRDTFTKISGIANKPTSNTIPTRTTVTSQPTQTPSKPTTPLVYEGVSINPNAPENERLRITADNNYNQKLGLYQQAAEDYKKARDAELANRGISSDYISKFEDATPEQKLTKPTKEQVEQSASDARKYQAQRQAIDEATKAEMDNAKFARNQLQYAKYLENVAKVANEGVTLYDQTLGHVVRGAQDLFSAWTDDNDYIDENGNTVYLPTYNQLKEEQARNNTLLGNIGLDDLGKFLGDVGYQGAKAGTSMLMNTVLPGSGSAVYFTDIYADSYRDNINNGMDNEGAMLNAFLKTGQNYIKQKLIGGLGGKLTQITGKDVSSLEKVFSKQWSKIATSPKVVAALSSMSAEAVDEFTDTYIEKAIDAATRDDVNIEDVFSLDTLLESLYSGAVGGATGVIGGINKNSMATAQQAINDRIANQNTQQNIDTQIQAETPQIQQNTPENINNQPTLEQTQLEPNEANNEPIRGIAENIENDNRNTSNSSQEEQNLINEINNEQRKLDNGTSEDDGFHLAELQKELQEVQQKSIANDSNAFNLGKIDENNTLRSVRSNEDISNRKTNAYQYDNPEVKPYFKDAALDLRDALENYTTKGERWEQADGTWTGTKFSSTPEITKLKDQYNMSYKDLDRGIEGIIKDEGAENNAASKKVELVIDDMLRNGYKSIDPNTSNPNQNYLDTLAGKPVDNQTNQQVDDDNPFFTEEEDREFLEKQNQIKEELNREQQAREQNQQVQQEQPTQNDNIPERKTDATNTIVINNNGKQTSSNADTKTEDTGVSINGKRVAIEVPTNTHKNSLGQDVLNNIDTEKVKKGDGDSRFYETITERSPFVKQEVKDRASQDDFIKHYDKITNQESLDNAINKLSQEGTSAISEFFSKNKQLTPDDTAMGIVLFEQAQNAGDYEMANNVLRKLRSNATTTAQVLQLYSVFSRMTPEGMYKYAGDQLLKAQEIFEKNKSKKWIEQNRDRWQLNPNEVEFIKSQMEKVQELNNSNEKMAEVSLKGYGMKDNGKTIKVTKERATQLEIAKIQKLIEDKIPAEKGQAMKAWMRISMLGNPKTIATRNPLGNLLISPVNTVGDYFGSAIDKLVSLKTKVRTKGGTNVPTSIKGFVEGGRESIQDKKIGVNTRDIAGNRFEIGQGKSFNENHQGILSKQRNKVSKVLNKMDRGVNFVLDLGDRPFYQASFENSLANQMKLNNIEDVDNAPQWMLDNAQQEALERTWQDDNKYTSFVLSVRKALNNLNVKGYGIGDLLIPFAKTPANLTKAIVDYSPAGLINAMTQGNNLRKSISNGQFTPQMQHQFVNQLGKAFAGSLLYVAAGALADAGIITGAADEDRDVADFMRYSLGIQPYSIVIGDSSFTYDWAQPVAAPFAIMADLKKKLDSSNGEADLGFILKSAISSSSSILLEQSFLQGIQDVLGGYGDPIDNLLSEIEGLPARAIPTFFQQIATLVDGKQRMSYGNDGISNVLSQAQAKVPVLASDLPVKRNSLGQEVERYGGENNIFNVFFNPANYSQGRATESTKEIYKIYQATNDKTILPRTVTNNIKNEDGTNLTNAQKSEFMRISGGIVDENIKELKHNKDYQKMSDEDKAAVIKKIVDYAYNKAREQVTNHTLASEYKKVDQAIETGYALYDYYATKQATKQTKTTSSNNSRNRYEEMQALGIDGETFDRFKAFVSTAKGESTTGGLTKKQKILNWINSQDLTREQKDNLYNDYVKNSKIYSSYN